MPHSDSHDFQWNSTWTNDLKKIRHRTQQLPISSSKPGFFFAELQRSKRCWLGSGDGGGWRDSCLATKPPTPKKEEKLEEESRHNDQILQDKPQVGRVPESPAPVWEERAVFQTRLFTKLKRSIALLRRWWWKIIFKCRQEAGTQ